MTRGRDRDAHDDLPVLPCVLRDRGRRGRQPRARGAGRPRPRDLPGLHLREGSPAPEPAPRSAPAAGDAPARARRLVRGGAERDGDGRGRGATAGHHRRARAAGRRALQRHEVVVERVVRARAELAERHRLTVVLLDRHRRPARQAHGRRTARVLAGRVPPDPAVRRRALRRHQPAAVVPDRGDQAALPQRARRACAPRCSGAST